jgi:hypothetical protein
MKHIKLMMVVGVASAVATIAAVSMARTTEIGKDGGKIALCEGDDAGHSALASGTDGGRDGGY